MNPTPQTLTSNLYVNDGGEGNIPVVFIHSFAGSSENWTAQLEHLRETRRAIAIDLPGHGHSAAPSGFSFTPQALAMKIASVVDGLHLNRFVLVGHSMGGSAAIAYASQNPERVAGLLVSGAPGKSDPEMGLQVVKSLESEKYEAVMKDYMKQLLKGSFSKTDKSIREQAAKLDKETTINIVKSLFWYDPLPDLAQYKGPKLIVSSLREKKQPNTLINQAPGYPRQIISGASHWTQMDKTDEFNKMLNDFLNEVIGV